MRLLFWLSAALIAYVYAGYPLLLLAWARVSRRRQVPASAAAVPPGVSIVIAARNEAGRLPGRIRNLLSLEYPATRRQIIVVSDGSTDNTAAALAPFGSDVELVTVPPTGKAGALNAGVARARFDILVFGDARQSFNPEALEALTAPMADPRVGCVTGELILGCEAGGRRAGGDRRSDDGGPPPSAERRSPLPRRRDFKSTVADAVGMYWRYEKTLRRLEGQVGSVLGATGAIYALRRELWKPLPVGTLLDDVLAPMRSVLAGRRTVFQPRAQAFDATAADASAEARRKIRTLAGNFQVLWLEPRILLPFVNPVWLQYMSHKVGRLVVPYGLIGVLAASMALVNAHPFYAAALAAQCAFYLLGGYGAWLQIDPRQIALAAFMKGSRAANA